MADALAATNLVDTIGSQATASQFRQIGATYFPHRHGLLGAEDRELLETGRAREIAGRALAQTYGIGFADGDLLRNDPFLLFPRFLMGLPAMASRLTMDDGMLSVTEGGVTWVGIIGTLRQEPYRLDVQSALVGAVDRVEQTAAAEDSRVRILRTGTVFFAEAGSRTAMQEASNLSTLSMIGTVLLILVVFRRVGPLAQNTVAVLVGIIVGVTATILIFGEIHAIALLFGTSLIGTSVDYGLFYCATALDPEGGSPAQRLRRILPALTLGLATTLAGYALLGFAPFPGLRQIAVLSAIGLFSAFLTVVAWLPLMDRSRPATAGAGAEQWLAFVDGFYEIWEADRWRLARWAMAGLVLAGAAIGVFRLNFDDDIRKLQALSRPLSAQQQQIFSLTGSSIASQYLLIHAPDDETALQSEERLAPILARLKAEHVLGNVQMPAAFAPSAARQAADEALVRERLTPLLSEHWRALGLDPGVAPAAPATGPLTLEQVLKPGGPPFVKDLILAPGLHVGALQGLTQPQQLAEAIKGGSERKVHKSGRGFQCAARQISCSRLVADHSLVRGDPRRPRLAVWRRGGGAHHVPALGGDCRHTAAAGCDWSVPFVVSRHGPGASARHQCRLRDILWRDAGTQVTCDYAWRPARGMHHAIVIWTADSKRNAGNAAYWRNNAAGHHDCCSAVALG